MGDTKLHSVEPTEAPGFHGDKVQGHPTRPQPAAIQAGPRLLQVLCWPSPGRRPGGGKRPEAGAGAQPAGHPPPRAAGAGTAARPSPAARPAATQSTSLRGSSPGAGIPASFPWPPGVG